MVRFVIRTLALSALAVTTLQAQRGTIRGVVTESGSNRPLPHAQVGVVGSTAGTVSDNEGRYTLAVTPGNVTVRVIRIGYGQQSKAVTVTAGQTATADFVLEEVATKLNPIVTTATGQQRRIEVGNAIAQVNAADIVETQAVSQVADLLVSKAAGVTVFSGVQTGAGTRVRIRGTSSLSLSNNPIFIIDGIRVEGTTGSSTLSVGGTTPSRLGDLNPEEIANIEIVRGPSASTLYGTDAANGVVVITTKRGTVGRPTWTTYTEQTAITDRNEYPTAYWGWRTGTTPQTTSSRSNTVQCFLTATVAPLAANRCVQDSVTTYNLHEDPESTPYGTGYRKQYGAQLSGGTEMVRYFLHGEYEDEDGVTKVPEFEKRYMAAKNRSLSGIQESPNRLTRMTGRANLNLSLTQQADASVSVGYITSDLRLPRSDDSGVSGVAANTYGGPGFKYNLTTAGDTLYGWRQFTPRDIYQAETNQAIERVVASSSGNYRPQDWLTLRGNVGIDYIGRNDTQLCRFENCPAVGTDRAGFKIDNRTSFYIYTVDASGTATRNLTDDIESKTTAGLQMYRNVFNRNGASSVTLPPGATTVTAGAVKDADETSSESRTLGSFLEQNIAYRDRLFLTGAVRSDRNSAFGADFKTVFYPKFSASWIPTEESFFPSFGWLDELRFRSAFGASGVQPGTIDAVQFFTPTTARGEAGDAPGVVFSTLGNRQLKPERSTELEMGLDITAFDGRLTTEVTRYQKSSKDALIRRVLPPSLGTGATDRLENLGQVKNQGWEALVTLQLMRGSRLGWDMTINGSANSNKLVSLGGVPNITVSSTQTHREGYPLYGWWSRGLTGFEDKNGNGIIEYSADAALTELTVTDTNVFHGSPLPKRELAIANTWDFASRRFRLQALVDYKGGHMVYNNTERIRCASRFNCEGLISPNASLFEQARTVMVREHPSRSVAGFFEKGDFWRFREVSLAYTASPNVAGWFRARNATVSAAMRNIGVLWTRYTGVDPEAFATTGDAPSEFQAFGPPTYFSFRLNLTY